MATMSTEQFLLSCINNSDLTKVDYAKVAADCNSTTGAVNKRYTRWKAKIQAEMDKGPGEGEGADPAEDGSASPTKFKKTPVKKAAEGKEGTPKKTPAKKTAAKKTPAKKRKVEEATEKDDGGAVKDEPMEDGGDDC